MYDLFLDGFFDKFCDYIFIELSIIFLILENDKSLGILISKVFGFGFRN